MGNENLEPKQGHQEAEADIHSLVSFNLSQDSARKNSRIICIGGGQGGTGKTLISANVGIFLAQMGKRVIVVDADLEGANLHTCLGIGMPRLNLSDFFAGRVKQVQDILLESEVEGLQLIGGKNDLLSSSDIKTAQKTRFLQQLSSLDVDYAILDLGSGTSNHVLDFFLIANMAVIVVQPEPTSVENAYRYLLSAFFRSLTHFAAKEEDRAVAELLNKTIQGEDGMDIKSPLDMLLELESRSPPAAEVLQKTLSHYRPMMVVNETRTSTDEKLGEAMRSISRRRFGIELEILGNIEYDDSAWLSIRKRKPILLEYADSPASEAISQIARRLLLLESGR